MAVEFKSSMSKNELLEIARGTRHRSRRQHEEKRHSKTAGTGTRRRGRTRSRKTAQKRPRRGNDPGGGRRSNTGAAGRRGKHYRGQRHRAAAEDAQEATPEGYGLFVYAGPSLPHGRLKEHAVFNGTFEDVKAYLADVLEDYPQAERLIVPVERLSAFAAKVKTPGNIAHKYYNDIVSTMRGNKEV